ncbi:MAG TPA: glucan biosynthesis protein G [Rudaea sp.]|nr:glucan biosynthesis protein G [Rudaea sp.]
MPLRVCLSFVALLAAPSVHAFGLADVDRRARDLASKAYKDTGANLPAAFAQLDQERYQAITYRPNAALWKPAKLPFTLEFFHEGWRFDRPVKIDEIAGSSTHEIAFNPQWFDYGKSGLDPIAASGLGYAGLRIDYAVNAPQHMDEVLSFLGATYFRALGKGQVYGLSARGLAIDTGLASGEEFPRFVEFWAERPKSHAQQLTIYALLDSPRASGAYRFVLKPGVDTTIEVTARLYLRENVGKLGVAPLTSMYFFGANQRAEHADYRPQVHDSDGLSIASSTGEWIWRPLVNPKRLLVTSFKLENPRGFGLMQRVRDFHAYEDLDAHYEAHPSAWVETLGNWGAGSVELVEIPSPDETNDNVVAYWIPEHLPAPKQPYEVHYRLHWQKDQETRPSTGWVAQTLSGKGYLKQADDSIGFVVDYVGPMFAGATDGHVEANVSAPANAQVVAQDVRRNPETGGWRIRVRFKRQDAAHPVELRASLRSDDKESETWSYVLPPE